MHPDVPFLLLPHVDATARVSPVQVVISKHDVVPFAQHVQYPQLARFECLERRVLALHPGILLARQHVQASEDLAEHPRVAREERQPVQGIVKRLRAARVDGAQHEHQDRVAFAKLLFPPPVADVLRRVRLAAARQCGDDESAEPLRHVVVPVVDPRREWRDLLLADHLHPRLHDLPQVVAEDLPNPIPEGSPHVRGQMLERGHQAPGQVDPPFQDLTRQVEPAALAPSSRNHPAGWLAARGQRPYRAPPPQLARVGLGPEGRVQREP